MKSDSERKSGAQVRCSELLDGQRCKASNNSAGTVFRTVDNTHLDLGEVYNPGGVMPVLIDALKKKGVRFEEGDFKDGEITYENKNIMILRGRAYEVVHRAFERHERRIARKKAAIEFVSGKTCSIILTRCYQIIQCAMRHLLVRVHNACVLPSNEKLSDGGHPELPKK